jgi:hypothetical protein
MAKFLRWLRRLGRRLVQQSDDVGLEKTRAKIQTVSREQDGDQKTGGAKYRQNLQRFILGVVFLHGPFQKNTPSGSKYCVPPAPDTEPLKSSAFETIALVEPSTCGAVHNRLRKILGLNPRPARK